MDKSIKRCSECNKEINIKEDIYYKCLDNFMQVKYFDTEDENIFCSGECFCKYLDLTEYLGDEEYE